MHIYKYHIANYLCLTVQHRKTQQFRRHITQQYCIHATQIEQNSTHFQSPTQPFPTSTPITPALIPSYPPPYMKKYQSGTTIIPLAQTNITTPLLILYDPHKTTLQYNLLLACLPGHSCPYVVWIWC